eukprot:2922029-Rhodomonas_salina.4
MGEGPERKRRRGKGRWEALPTDTDDREGSVKHLRHDLEEKREVDVDGVRIAAAPRPYSNTNILQDLYHTHTRTLAN